ncbi:MAG TPA: AraC family transcriptional regulator [Planctomycetota bacterium]|nr:AraC family transcriptional regulator [Planctomycetota bacterium]
MADKLLIKNYIPKGEYYHVGISQKTSESTREIPVHCHDFHEFFWLESGRCWHHINGRKRLISAGMLVLVRAPDTHGFSVNPGESCRFVNVAFHKKTWDDLRERYFEGQRDPFGPGPEEQREIVLSPGELEYLRQTAPDLEPHPHTRVAIDRLLLNVLHRTMKTLPQPEGQKLPEWLDEACRRIGEEENFQKGAPMFARLAHRSPEHVARETRRYLGKTPTDIVNEARMAFAARKLAGSSDKILDIAMQCGVENLSHFYRLFEQRYGVTPRRYRVQQQRITGA